MKLNSPEWFIILIGCIASLASGIIQPIFVVLIAKIIQVRYFTERFLGHQIMQAFNYCTYEERRRHVLIRSGLSVLFGIIALAIRVFLVRM